MKWLNLGALNPASRVRSVWRMILFKNDVLGKSFGKLQINTVLFAGSPNPNIQILVNLLGSFFLKGSSSWLLFITKYAESSSEPTQDLRIFLRI